MIKTCLKSCYYLTCHKGTETYGTSNFKCTRFLRDKFSTILIDKN